jgi:hypothetical protein
MSPSKLKKKLKQQLSFFNDTIQGAGWNPTPEHTDTFKIYECPILITQKNHRKRDCRSSHRLQTPENKWLLNAATQELKQFLINKNDSIQTFLQLLPKPKILHA